MPISSRAVTGPHTDKPQMKRVFTRVICPIQNFSSLQKSVESSCSITTSALYWYRGTRKLRTLERMSSLRSQTGLRLLPKSFGSYTEWRRAPNFAQDICAVRWRLPSLFPGLLRHPNPSLAHLWPHLVCLTVKPQHAPAIHRSRVMLGLERKCSKSAVQNNNEC